MSLWVQSSKKRPTKKWLVENVFPLCLLKTQMPPMHLFLDATNKKNDIFLQKERSLIGCGLGRVRAHELARRTTAFSLTMRATLAAGAAAHGGHVAERDAAPLSPRRNKGKAISERRGDWRSSLWTFDSEGRCVPGWMWDLVGGRGVRRSSEETQCKPAQGKRRKERRRKRWMSAPQRGY